MPATQGWSVTMPVKRKSFFQQPRIFSCRSSGIEPESRDSMNGNPSDDKDVSNEEETEAESVEFPLVHERQVRQLCAVHAVNNLLQLDSIADEEEKNDTLHQWICNGTKLPWTKEQILPATKKELDDIADGLTLVECKLLSLSENEYEINIAAQSIPEVETLSMYQRLHSNHRTPVVGNYSFEVIETALQKRGVSLSWYKLDEAEFSDSTKDISLSGNSSLSNSGSEDEMVIGYILNKVDEKEDDTCWAQQYAQRLPWVGRYFEPGRHWYAITRIRIEGTSTTTTAGVAPSEVWRVLDSDSDTVLEYANDLELWKYLQSIQDHITGNPDTSIFRATLKLNKSQS